MNYEYASAFSIQHSAFSIQHSAFNIQPLAPRPSPLILAPRPSPLEKSPSPLILFQLLVTCMPVVETVKETKRARLLGGLSVRICRILAASSSDLAAMSI
jgi:hypothetical protein